MNKFDFVAGYYEWNVIENGEIAHSFNDFSELIQEEATREDIEILVDNLLWQWKEECREQGGYVLTEENELNELAKVMTNNLCNYYGI